ncbi:DUF2306 domain-containing protein [Acidicapsa acidisoli]|uniref:DUF2306 domain-containing protein n=1 Tax=Acidicapsa acidisoli TaxID=1615681 RepID=UPI0021DF9E2C|nr:DUF2306 domain-containing protein [Acidicapsa acidisoli]
METYSRRNQQFLESDASPLLLRIGFWACIVISVAVVVRRFVALVNPPKSAPPQLAALDTAFASHAILTLAHILPALAFVLILPVYFLGNSTIASFAERLIFPLGAIVGITAYAMSAYSIGGWLELSAVLFFNSIFLISLARAYWFGRRGEAGLKRRWLVRAVVVLLGIATTRPVMGVFFATAPLTHLAPSQFFGIAFWIGFSINTIVVELWLRTTRQKSLQIASKPAPG